MKSTQDLCMWLKQLEVFSKKETQLIIASDKSFVIVDNTDGIPDSEQLLITSEQLAADINDLPYLDPKLVARQIKEDLSVRNITVEDL